MQGKLDANWYQGPVSDVPLSPQHDRQILCMDIQGNQVVTGSADHGLRVYNINSGKQMRQLYAKQYGHAEWVTSCAFLKDGRVLSGGMDKLLCLWDARLVKCQNLTGHNGSISKVKVDQFNVGITAAYDSSLLVWNLDTLECLQGLFNGHKDAVMEFEWANSLVVSGGRDGSMAVWDINTGSLIQQMQPHNGPVSKIAFYSDGVGQNLIISAGLKDGILAVHDMRTHKIAKKERVHQGAINMLDTSLSSFIVTGSADKTLKKFDIINNFKPIGVMNTTDAVFCGKIIQNLALAGCGDGNILAFDLDTNKCLYGYGADSMGAVHCMAPTEDLKALITGGDSGQGLKINFSGF